MRISDWSSDVCSSDLSSGAYLTGSDYQGQHGLSQRLTGLDPDNSNAAVRAIVIHSAWYVSHKMIDDHGKLGRSEGCFAFDEADLSAVMGSEESRVGKEWVSTCRSRWSP